MDVSGLRRDGDKVKACIKELPDGSLIATKRLRVHIPTRFEDVDLAVISTDIHTVGLFSIITDEGLYAVMNVNAMVQLKPSAINTVKINEVTYYEFTFEAGSVFCPTTDLVKNDVITYYIFEEIFTKGNVPYYLGYDDLGNIFDTAIQHAGTAAGSNKSVMDIIASIIARDPKNPYQQYRHVVKDRSTLFTNPPMFVPLDAIQFTATNTTAKLAGAYMQEGVVSALVNPSKQKERIEDLLTR